MSQSTTVQCPHCGQQYTMTPQQAGQTVQCIQCHTAFTAGVSTQATGMLAQALADATPGSNSPASGDNYGYAGPPGSNGMAIASLVCGILFCIPLSSVLAIIFGIMGLSKTKDRRFGAKGYEHRGADPGDIRLGDYYTDFDRDYAAGAQPRARDGQPRYVR